MKVRWAASSEKMILKDVCVHCACQLVFVNDCVLAKACELLFVFANFVTDILLGFALFSSDHICVHVEGPKLDLPFF